MNDDKLNLSNLDLSSLDTLLNSSSILNSGIHSTATITTNNSGINFPNYAGDLVWSGDDMNITWGGGHTHDTENLYKKGSDNAMDSMESELTRKLESISKELESIAGEDLGVYRINLEGVKRGILMSINLLKELKKFS